MANSTSRRRFQLLQADLAATIAARGASEARLRGIAMRGFTTSRRWRSRGRLVQAIERGHVVGPSLFIAGRAITQTGGHGATRPAFFRADGRCICAGRGGARRGVQSANTSSASGSMSDLVSTLISRCCGICLSDPAPTEKVEVLSTEASFRASGCASHQRRRRLLRQPPAPRRPARTRREE